MLSLFILLAVIICNLVTAQSTCSEYGVGAVSECTSGFASLYHIDTIEGNTNIRSYSVQRQSIFPDITFNCSGKITKWVFAANWEGNSLAHTELQIWRKRGNRNVYDRVGSTTVRVSSRNITEVYEHVVNPPLAFQEGDILGYFQPYGGTSQLNLYLEESERTMSIIRLSSDDEDESDDDSGQQSNVINLNSGHLRGNDYPLIHVETDPPACACGFMTTERINALVNITSADPGDRVQYPLEQVIFPNITFACSGWVMKWIMGATYSSGIHYPELQIWRPSGDGTYRKLNGTIAAATGEENNRIYEFIVDPPLPFQPDDILGLFQPSQQNSRLLVDYDSGGDELNVHLPLDSNQVEPSHAFVNVNNGGWQTRRAVPLVSAEIVMDRAPAITAITSHTTASQSLLSVVSHTPITLTPTLHVSASVTSQVTSMDIPASTIVSEELISLRILVTKSVVAISSTSTINMETQTIQTTPLVTSFQVDTSLISVATTALTSSSVAAAISLSSLYVDASPTPVTAAMSTSSVYFDASPTLEAAAISTSSLYFDFTPVLSSSVTSRQGIPFYVSLGVVCLLLVLICAIVIALLAFYWSQKKSKLKMTKTAPDSEMHFNTNMMYESANSTNVEHVYDEPDTRRPCQPRFKLMTNTSESTHTISAYAVTAIPKPAIENTSSIHQSP